MTCSCSLIAHLQSEYNILLAIQNRKSSLYYFSEHAGLGKAPSRAGWLGGVSLVMFSHRNIRKHQASIFCGSIPQHNAKQHQGSRSRCYVRWASQYLYFALADKLRRGLRAEIHQTVCLWSLANSMIENRNLALLITVIPSRPFGYDQV